MEFLDNLLAIQKATTRTLKSVVQMLSSHTNLLVGILEKLEQIEEQIKEQNGKQT